MQDEHDGFDAFMEDNYRPMFRYCISRVFSEYDADSITNDAFQRLWEKWSERKSCSDEDNIKWLYNAIKIIIHEEYRNKKKNKHADIEDHVNQSAESDFTENVVGDIVFHELKENIENHLDEDEKKLMNLKVLGDTDYSVLEKEFDVNYQTLRVRVHRLKEKIKKIIKNIKNV